MPCLLGTAECGSSTSALRSSPYRCARNFNTWKTTTRSNKKQKQTKKPHKNLKKTQKTTTKTEKKTDRTEEVGGSFIHLFIHSGLMLNPCTCCGTWADSDIAAWRRLLCAVLHALQQNREPVFYSVAHAWWFMSSSCKLKNLAVFLTGMEVAYQC